MLGNHVGEVGGNRRCQAAGPLLEYRERWILRLVWTRPPSMGAVIPVTRGTALPFSPVGLVAQALHDRCRDSGAVWNLVRTLSEWTSRYARQEGLLHPHELSRRRGYLYVSGTKASTGVSHQDPPSWQGALLPHASQQHLGQISSVDQQERKCRSALCADQLGI